MEIAIKSFLSTTIICEQDVISLLYKNIVQDDELLTRLFKKYIKYEDIKDTFEVLKNHLNKFVQDNKNYKNVADKLISAFKDAIELTDHEKEKYNEYTPIRFVIADSPYRYFDIPLEDYDNLEGDPLWMRPDYVLEKYGSNPTA